MNIIDQIDADIAKLEMKKRDIQGKCSHPSVTSALKHVDEIDCLDLPEASWAENTCNLCGHKWTVSK